MPFDLHERKGGTPRPDPRRGRLARMIGYTLPFLIIGGGFFFAALWATSWLWEAVFMVSFGWVQNTHYRAMKRRFFGG